MSERNERDEPGDIVRSEPAGGWDRAQLQRLRAAAARGEPLVCPACGGAVAKSPVAAPPGVPYVRHRMLLVCAGCRRSAAVDVPAR